MEQKTKIEHKFAFWYRISEDALIQPKQLNQNEYENQVKKIADFDTVTFYIILSYNRLKIFGKYFSIYASPTHVNQE